MWIRVAASNSLYAIGFGFFVGAALDLLKQKISPAVFISIALAALAFSIAYLLNPPKKEQPPKYQKLGDLPRMICTLQKEAQWMGESSPVPSKQQLDHVFGRFAKPCHIEVLWYQRNIGAHEDVRYNPLVGIMRVPKFNNECPGWQADYKPAKNGMDAKKVIEALIEKRKKEHSAEIPWDTTSWQAEYRTIEKVRWVYYRIEIRQLSANQSATFLSFHFFVNADEVQVAPPL